MGSLNLNIIYLATLFWQFKSNQETYGTASCQGNYVLWYSQEYLCSGDALCSRFLSSEDPPPSGSWLAVGYNLSFSINFLLVEHAGWSIHCLVSETNDGSYSVSLVSMLPAVVEIITGCGKFSKLYSYWWSLYSTTSIISEHLILWKLIKPTFRVAEAYFAKVRLSSIVVGL